MISTIAITTVTAMIGLSKTMGIAALVALLLFLCTKELAAASHDSKPRLLAKSVDVATVPLLIAFVMVTVMKIVEVLA